MTNQPDDKVRVQGAAPVQRTPRDFLRRADGTWNVVPLLLGVLVIAAVTYVFVGDPFTGRDHVTSPPIENGTK